MTEWNLIFFYLYMQEISRIAYKKTLDMCMPCETQTHIYNKHMLITQDYVKFRGRIAWQSFLVNNFADFTDVVQVKKKSRFRSVVGGVLL